MQKTIKKFIWVVLLFFVAGNIYMFCSGIAVSDTINNLEQKTKKLHQENKELEKHLYEVESLQYAASMAANLNFTVSSQPIYLNSLKYAQKR